MADSIQNTRHLVAALTTFFGGTVRAMLMQAAHVPNQDQDYVSDISANEASGASYARKTLANVAVAVDDANNRVEVDADDLTQANSNAFASPTTSQEIIGVQLYRQVGGDDTTPEDDELVAFLSFGGGDVTAVNQATDVFTVAGEGSQAANFEVGDSVEVHGSTGNDGTYTVVTATDSGGDLLIEVSEEIPNATADGTLYKLVVADGNNIEYTFAAEGFAHYTT